MEFSEYSNWLVSFIPKSYWKYSGWYKKIGFIEIERKFDPVGAKAIKDKL